MKNLLLAAALTVCLFTSAFAIDESKISVTVRESFKEDFKGIDKVNWSIKPNFVKASFTYNGNTMDAFYDFSGKKIGTSQHVSLSDLPLSARKKISDKYENYRVTEAIEFTGEEENSYYVSLANEKETVVLKITDQSTVSLFKKSSKNRFY